MSDNLVDRNHFSQLMCMYIDIATETVLKVFYCLIPKDSVGQFLSNPKTIQVLKGLKLKRVLTSKEYTLLTTSNPNPDRFDISLLITLSTLIPEADLPVPKNGWRSPPAHSDQSVAADLLRLRKIRNNVLCHRPKAELPEVKFEHFWREIEEILVRLIQQVHPGEETSLKGRIHSYRQRETDIAKYETLLNDWCEEINDIQEQIEAQLRNIAEFAAYFKVKPVRYERYIKLLMEGGRLVLHAFLQKELDERGACLRDLLNELKENEAIFKAFLNDDSSLDKLDLNTEHYVQLDTLVLTKVIRYGFKDLDSEDREEIEKIQHARENYADIARLSLDSDTFADYREDLIASLISLSRMLRKEVRTKLRKLIQECKSRHEDTNSSDSETYIDRLRQTGLKIKTLADVIQETILELKNSLTQLQKDGIDLKRNHCLEIKLHTACNNEEIAQTTEEELVQIIKEAIENAADTIGKATVRNEVDKLLELICGNDGVEKCEVYRHCIIIRISCSTIDGILHIISLFENESFNFVFRNISSEMTIEFFETVSIHASLTLESLCEILVHKGDGSHKKQGITMPITVTSAEGLNHVMSLFESRLVDESASHIAKTLSSQFGEEITLQISNGFEGHLQKKARGTSSIQSIPWVPEENKVKERQKHLLTGSKNACSLEDVPENGNGNTHLKSPINQQGTKLILHGATSESSDEDKDDYNSGEGGDDNLKQDICHVPEAFENDPYYLKLYTEAITDGKEKDSTVRLNVVGCYGQGKTTLIKRLVQETIEGVESTNSVEIKHCKYDHMQDDLTFSTSEELENEDDITRRIAAVAHSEMMKDGQDDRNHSHDNSELHSTSFSLYLGKKIYINKDSKTEKKNCKQPFEIQTEKTKEVVKIGHRSLGSFESKQELNRGEESFIPQLRMLLRHSQNNDEPCRYLEIWDYGGQFSFYATHNLFHSTRAVYLLVFDITKPLSSIVKDSEFPDREGEMTMEQYAKFWINSIHAYVGSENGQKPPVILVGTHKDMLEGDEHAKQEFVEEYFEQVRKLFENTNMLRHIQPTVFAVDNLIPNDNCIAELRREVIKQGTKLAEKNIPAKWIPLERAVRRHRHEKIISFDKLMDIDAQNEFPLEEEEQVRLFLRYHHSKGTLLYYDEEPISAYVVLDSQYLIDAFKCIVTSKRFCRKNYDTRDLLNVLTTEARLENELIDKLWGRDTENDFLKHKRELLMFLVKHSIISEALIYCEESQKSQGLGWYIVPSLLRSKSTEDVLTEFLITGRRGTSVRFVMSFNQSPLVQVLFYRLLAALIGRWPVVQTPRKKTLVYENLGVFRLDENHAGIVVYKLDDIELLVQSLVPSKKVDGEWPNKFRRFSEFVVKNEFMKFRHSATQQENPYNACFKCNDESHGPSGGATRVPTDDIWLGTKGKRECRDNCHHEIYPDQVRAEWLLGDKAKELFQDRQLKDKELSQVALAIGGINWGYLGLNLGLDSEQIKGIDRDYETSEMKIYTMLCRWKAQKEDGATVNALIHAIKTEKRVFVDWDEIRNILDKISSDGLEN